MKGKNQKDVAALKELISKHDIYHDDLDSSCYTWDSKGNLTGIDWLYEDIGGAISFSKLENLEYLNCCDSQLNSLDVSGNTALTELNCSDNQLSSLDVSKNTALTKLDCDETLISSMDVSKNTALTWFICDDTVMVIGYSKE